jgi:drug/metabolite transporter (DMT)-like permease
MATLVKYISNFAGDDQIVFIRSVTGLILVLPVVFYPQVKTLATTHFANHAIRGVAAVLALYAFFYSIHHIVLADAVLLNNTMPLFVPFILFFWKGEKIPKGIIYPLAVSFIGVILIIRPGEDLFHIGSVVALISGILLAISTCGVRILGKHEPAYRIMFYTFLIGTIFTATPLFWRWETPTLFHLLLMIGVGVFGTIYQFFVTKGYQYASPTKISPIIYLAVILSGFFDWIIWNQVPRKLSYAGIVLVIVGAYFCMRIEAKAKHKKDSI